jgi:DNA (cytosine-5)-methyltransferase 1
MAFAGECWTLSTSESPSDATESFLPDVLETGPHLSKYFLSPKAATGILRRAGRRGRELPPHLAIALSQLSRAEDGEATG